MRFARFGMSWVLTGVAIAQATHFVGTSGFPTIDAALAAAAPGDIVVVAPGTWAGFTVTRAVTIRAATPATAFVGGVNYVNGAAGVVHLVDLDMVWLAVTNASCNVDHCRVVGAPATIGSCLSASGATLRLVGSHVGSHGTPPSIAWFLPGCGLYADASVVSAVDTTILGRDIDSYHSNPLIGAGPGVALTNGSTLHASRMVIEGGDGETATAYPPGGAVVATNSTFWITDSSLRCGHALSSGGAVVGCPVVGVSGRLTRCSLVPVACPPTVPTSGAMVGTHLVAPLQAGASFQIDFQVQPNDLVGVFASLDTSHVAIPELEQPVGLDLGSVFALDVLLADVLGQASGTWALPAGTSNLRLWLQGLTTAASPLQLSPPVGGVVR